MSVGYLFFLYCFNHSVGLVVRGGFLTFPCLWEISFSIQMIVELSVGYWALIGSSSDHIIILPVGCWSWREFRSWIFGSGLF